MAKGTWREDPPPKPVWPTVVAILVLILLIYMSATRDQILADFRPYLSPPASAHP